MMNRALPFAVTLLVGVAVCLAQDPCDGVSPVSNTTLTTVPVATGLGPPLYVTAPQGDHDRIFIADQNGRIRLKKRGEPPSTTHLFLDISAVVNSTSDPEMGLLGLAFHPDYAQNGFFYVSYTEGPPFASVVARYSVDPGNPDLADPGSELRILTVDQPALRHNVGHLLFGADGYLYIGSGDGGVIGDNSGTCGNGQNTGTLLGTVMRIDVDLAASGAPDCGDGPSNYSVPPDNPFVDGPGGDCDEIWSYGLRNPWRFTFDPEVGDLYLGDVGERCWEEINWVAGSSAAGSNFGWRQMEGSHCFDPNTSNCDPNPVPCPGVPDCNDPSLIAPVIEYGRSEGRAVVGGFVYRGCRMPGFHGTYFYGDWGSGSIRSFRIVGGQVADPQDWTTALDPDATIGLNDLTSFGLDSRGEIYITDRDGEVLKIAPPFADLQVSGPGAEDSFLLHRDGDWSWEDLEYTTMHPIAFYRVYRGVPGGVFSCIHSTFVSGWVDGDVTVPDPGALLAYVVTAVSPTGEESSSGDPARTLSDPCPSP
jgi:glucose/arabinose dehydrogenase